MLSADLGLPDVGLTTLTEVSQRTQQIARMTDLPTLVDVDTGFGEPMNVARTVQSLEEAGASAVHLEDQENPKRCGHLDGKVVVDTATATKRIRAAVDARRDPNFLIMARTDIRAVDGLDAAIDRAKALVDAGADAIFPEAMADLGEFEAVRRAIDVPILANMTEFGKSELFTREQLARGRDQHRHLPGDAAAQRDGGGRTHPRRHPHRGQPTLRRRRDADRARLYELLDYPAYNTFDSSVFNFTLGQ